MEIKNQVTGTSGQQLLNETKIDSYSVIFFHTFHNFIRWWYIKMPIWHLRKLARITVFVNDQLSLGLLLKNFLTPWHRDYSVMGYAFGIIIKILYIPIATIIFILCILIYLLILLLWFLLPIGTLTFILISIFK